jgi:hypothetical protein
MQSQKVSRLFIVLLSATMLMGSAVAVLAQPSTDKNAIRPFRLRIPQAALDDLRRRIAATRWPERETVSDGSQGVQLAAIQALARYWMTDYDWRKCEAKLNALPQFITEIDGLDIHFIHVRSKNPNALPLIVTHGWPGSILEQIKIIDPLTNPVAYGGRAEDSFDVVIPSMPGYGFSGRLGYEKYTRDFNKLIWRLGSPKWSFDDATFERSVHVAPWRWRSERPSRRLVRRVATLRRGSSPNSSQPNSAPPLDHFGRTTV